MVDSMRAGEEVRETASVLTFLIADIRGYTRFTVEHGDSAAASLASRFAAIVDETASAHEGRVVELRGDEALCVFSSARQALRGAVALQEHLQEATRDDLPLRAGIGIDSGEALPVNEGYRGAAINLAARLCSLAGPGETFASDTVANLARKLDGVEYADRGYAELKGFSGPVRVIGVSRSQSRESPPAGESPLLARERSSVPIEPESPRHAQRLPIGGFLGALPDSDLVARDEERRRIAAAVDSAAGGEGKLLLVAGEAGVGKTRLAQEATLTAQRRGLIVLTGRCYQAYSAVPLYPFREALVQAFELAPDSIRDEVKTRWPYLSRLIPDASIPVPPPAENNHEEQQRLFWSITSFFQVMSVASPIALLLDDLHWSDATSLELLQHIARLTRGCAIFIFGTYRETEIGPRHPLQRVALDLVRERLAERILLKPMDRDDTAALMSAAIGEGAISGEVADLVFARTEGNPFFTQEVLRSLVEKRDIYADGDQWLSRPGVEIEVPETILAVIDQRLSTLSERSYEILNAAGVLGQVFFFDDLLAMLECTEEELETALDEAIGAGLARAGSSDEYSFNHVLTQQALYARLAPRRRRRLHIVAGNALERLPEAIRERRATELAWHFLEGGDAERGLPYAVLAGDAAEAVFAHGDAAVHYGRALELAERIGDDAQEARVREKLGGLLTATIRYAAALNMLEAAARLFHAGGDWESEGRVIAQIGRVHVVDGSIDDGLIRLSTFLPTLEPRGQSSALANVLSSLAHLYFASRRYDDALRTSREAAEMAVAVAEPAVQAEAEARHGATLAMIGRLDEAEERLRAAAADAEAARDVFSRCRALQSLAGIALLTGDPARARVNLEQALGLATHMGNRRQIAVSHFGLSIQALVSGDMDTSSMHAERALTIMHALEGSWATACQIPGLDPLSLPAKQLERAGQYLRECVAICERGIAGRSP